MKNIPVKYQVTFGLICLLVSIMSLAGATGFAPNERSAVLRGRGQLSSTLAIQSSVLLNKREHKSLQLSLDAIVERNEDIVSVALRKRTGHIEISSGEHKENWIEEEKGRSIETHMVVPLHVGKQSWGQLEVNFKPVFADQPTAQWLSPRYLYMALVAILCVFAFAYYLGKVLKQLDPSEAVPRQVEKALNTLTEGLILTDAKGRVRLANDAFCQWVGRASRKLIGIDPTSFPWSRGAASGTTSWDVAANESGKMLMPWVKAIENRSPVAGTLLQLPNVDGKQMTLIANSSPIIGAKGDYVGVLTSFEDVTDLEKHKVALAKAKQNADDANKAKSEFLARMSHEIRTPMNAILGYAEVLRENLEEDPETRQKHLGTIHNSGEHLLALINDILDLSKIESGQMELERAPVSIFGLIQEVVSVLKIKAEEKGIYLRSEYGSAMPVTIMADSVRLRQSVINLVGNAIKFTDTGGVTIHADLVRKPKSKSMMLNIRVQDTGIGMSPAARDKIFQPFSQADTSITRRFGGTGLGLAICKELAEKMGGSISVESEPGRGSSFNLMIDIGDVSGVELVSERDAQLKDKANITQDREVDLPPMHVLIVDDGDTNRRLVSVYLRKENATFEMACNGKEAVEKVNSGNFDVVLMDMHMPIMDGFEATRTLRQQGHQIPIIALTANAMAQDKKECRDAGCSSFLSKPINRERLLTELSTAVTGTVKTRMKVPSETTVVTKQPRPTEPTVPVDQPAVSQQPDSKNAEITETTVAASETKTIPLPAEKETETVATSTVFDTGGPIGSSLPMDDEDFVYVAELFVDSLNAKVESMVNALVEQDFDQLFELGHWLKGASGSAGYDCLSDPGMELESAAKDDDLKTCLDSVREICKLASRVRVTSNLEHQYDGTTIEIS